MSWAIVLKVNLVLTRPRIRVIMNTNWEANINRKYSVESSTMVDRRTETLIPLVFNFAVDEMINAKARMSDSHALAMGSTRWGAELPTYHNRGKRQSTQSLEAFAGKIDTSDIR